MDNQHRQISGYRELDEDDIATINEIKTLGEQIGRQVLDLQARGPLYDQRWIAIGKTDLQQGIMALVRGVAQPTTF